MRIERSASPKAAKARRLIPGAPLFILFVAFGVVFSLAIAFGQPGVGNSVKGFKAPLNYFENHPTNVQSYLEGSESEMGPDGTIILHDAKLQTFHEDGSREMIMNAPQCFYDYSKHVVRSSGPLQVQTWDDGNKRSLQLQGSNGFYWQQTNSLLIVSNHQMTTISGPLTNSFNP